MDSNASGRPISLPRDIVLNASRITLRHLAASDLGAIHALRADPRIMKYSATHVPDASPEVTWEKIKTVIPPDNDYELTSGGSYHFVVCLTSGLQTGASAYTTTQAIAPGALVGDMGILKFIQASDGIMEGEVGYMLDPRLWGRGLASEALQVFVEHWRSLCNDNGLHTRLTAIVEPENVASQKVLEKGGFKERRRFTDGPTGDLLAEMELDIRPSQA